MDKEFPLEDDMTLVDFGYVDDNDPIESTISITPRILKARAKSKCISAMKKEVLADILTTLPKKGEYYHIVSNGKFDYFSFLPVILDKVKHIDEFYGSTWTMNRKNVIDLLEYIDKKQIDKVTILSGLYFKRRETAVYATLLQGLSQRGMRYIACENHAKVMLIRTGNDWYVIEGSANWTSNPRIEQNTMINSKEVYQFHLDWMETIFEG